jgi:4-amino-4-deoxychorismate lyase
VGGAIVNGVALTAADPAIAISDRGLNYGDGLFETMLLSDGRVRFLDAHLERLVLGCRRLQIDPPRADVLRKDVASVLASQREGIVKIVVTRGSGGRGYRPDPASAPTRIVSLHELPAVTVAIHARWCETRLSRNPALAGIKHLNRLEQVLAQQEWSDASIAEGLMLDHEGELVCATAANVFVVQAGELKTPDLRFCGVRGIMRDVVIRTARQLGIGVHEEALWPRHLETADEVFVTNAVRGVRSVVALGGRTWREGSMTQAIREAVIANA